MMRGILISRLRLLSMYRLKEQACCVREGGCCHDEGGSRPGVSGS